jgi:YVTN family beta-propeller protein
MNFGFRTAPRHNVPAAVLTGSLIGGAIALLSQPALAQSRLDPPSSGLTNPRAIVFSPATGKVYAVDTEHGAVQIYSGTTPVPRQVQVGAGPVSIAVNTASGKAYVANADAGTVSVIDGASDAVVATVAIGSHPYSIAADSATGKVYVTHTFGDQLSILDGATNTATELKTGSSDLIAIDSRKGTIYLLGYGGEVKVLDRASQKLIERPVGKHAWGLTLDDVTGKVYVARIEDADLAALDGAGASAPEILPAGEIPCAIAVNSKANRLYTANYGENTVSAIDAVTGHILATIPVGSHPKSIAFDTDRNLLYVANTLSGTVTVIDAGSNAVLATLPAGKRPYGLAVVPGSNWLYVANEAQDNSSTAVDLSAIHKTDHKPGR